MCVCVIPMQKRLCQSMRCMGCKTGVCRLLQHGFLAALCSNQSKSDLLTGHNNRLNLYAHWARKLLGMKSVSMAVAMHMTLQDRWRQILLSREHHGSTAFAQMRKIVKACNHNVKNDAMHRSISKSVGQEVVPACELLCQATAPDAHTAFGCRFLPHMTPRRHTSVGPRHTLSACSGRWFVF